MGPLMARSVCSGQIQNIESTSAFDAVDGSSTGIPSS